MSAIHHRACNLCEAMCGLEIEHHEGRVLAIRGDAEDPLSRGFLCVKARALQEVYEDPDRLRHPLRRRGSDWEEVSWEEALDEIAARLLAVQARHGRDAVAVYMGNPTVHDYGAMIGAALLEASLGTASRFSASSVDQLPRTFVSRLLYGHQALLPIPDVDRTAHFLVVGANPVASNGSLMGAPGISGRLAELRRRGGKVVVVDPRRTETAAVAGEHHFIRPGTDALLLLAMLQVIFAEGRSRPGRLAAFTSGLDELAGIAARFPPERVSAATGIAAGEIRRLARELAEAPAAAPYGRVGACTQRFGGLTTWLLDALAIATGNLDREGGLLFARPAFDLVALGSRLGIEPAEIGRHRTRVRALPSFGGQLPAIALAEEIDTPGRGQLRALLTIAGNPVLSLPDGGRLERALGGGLELMVSIDLYLNETTRFADFILPAAQALEQDHYDLALHLLTVRNTARYSPPLFAPSAGVRPSWQILAGLASRLDRGNCGPRGLGRLGAGLKWRLLERLGPAGLLDLGLRLGPYGDRFLPWSRGLSLARLRQAPHGLDFGALAPRLPALLHARPIDLVPEPLRRDLDRLEAALDEPLATGGLMLIGRRHLRDNNSWLHNSPRLLSGRDRCTLLMHPGDAATRRLADGDRVRVRSRTGTVEVPLAVSSGVMPGVVSLPHGYGHGRPGTRLRVAAQHAGASLNDLTDGELFDELTGNAGLNGTPVSVEAVVKPAGSPPAPG
jgi:anaerobic selenocysteine-containing dehydrogenase